MPAQDVEFSEPERNGFAAALQSATRWAEQHGWQVGVAEIAIGGAMLAVGIESGAIELGHQLVVSVLEDGQAEGLFGGAVGSALGALPGLVVKSIGVAAMGTAISVPALVLVGGGALVMGLAGYGTGRLVAEYLNQAPSFAELIGPGSLTLVGTALLLDGARRISSDPDVQRLVSQFSDGVLHLAEVAGQRLLLTKDQLLQHLVQEIRAYLSALERDPLSAAATVAGVGAGAAVGGAVAASSVTVLGSSSLGAVALSLGLVSAPLWPVLAGAGGAAIASYGVWKYLKRRGRTGPAMQGIEQLRYVEPLRITHEATKKP